MFTRNSDSIMRQQISTIGTFVVPEKTIYNCMNPCFIKYSRTTGVNLSKHEIQDS